MHVYNYCPSLFFPFLYQIEVSLTKDPTLGLGITGGSDGENTVKPGDTVSSFSPLSLCLPDQANRPTYTNTLYLLLILESQYSFLG